MKPVLNKRFVVKALRIVLFFLLAPLFSYPQDSVKQDKFVFTGYVKDMQSFIFQDIKDEWTSANLVHNRLNIKWHISPSFTAGAEIRNRLLYGNILTNFPGYNHTFEADNGIVKLTKNLIDEKSFLMNSSVDRLWLQYSTDKFQITAGRQRINWGQTFVWNPNDIFNTYSYFDFDYEEKPGSDAIRVQYFAGPASVIEFAVKVNNQDKATMAALYRFNRWNYDFQFIGGMVDQEDLVLGTGWSGQVLDGGFRGEATYFHPRKSFSDTTGIFLASAGYDYTFKNSLFFQFEALYNGNNQSSGMFLPGQFSSSVISPKSLFLPDFSMFASLSYPVTPLFNASLASIVNPKSDLFFIVPFMDISLKENLELSFTAQLMRYFGEENNNEKLNFLYVRLKYSF